MAGLVPGLVVGWLIAPAFDDIVNRSQSAIGVAFIGAAIGLAIGSFAGMGRAQARCNARQSIIDRSQTIEGGGLRSFRLIRRSGHLTVQNRHPHPDRGDSFGRRRLEAPSPRDCRRLKTPSTTVTSASLPG